jgi:hypothetical protein
MAPELSYYANLPASACATGGRTAIACAPHRLRHNPPRRQGVDSFALMGDHQTIPILAVTDCFVPGGPDVETR